MAVWLQMKDNERVSFRNNSKMFATLMRRLLRKRVGEFASRGAMYIAILYVVFVRMLDSDK